MNKILATVCNIENIDNLNIVEFEFKGIKLKMMSLDLRNINISTKVNLIVKPTHVSIAKKFEGNTSFENVFKATLVDMERGKLLCNIKLRVNDILLESIITKHSFNTMKLKLQDEVTVFIKASDISILEIIND